jgi:hypothetical protein
MGMRSTMILGLLGIWSVTAALAGERRQLDAHEHGRSTLDIAIEGGSVVMELTAPGADIVGFEHPAATDAQKAAIAAARIVLADPLALFVPPPAAGCRVATATVDLETEDHGGEHAGEESGGHAAFHTEYALDCADPAALGSLGFAFFDRFPDAAAVAVRLVTERGQTTYEVERAAPHLVLDGLT